MSKQVPNFLPLQIWTFWPEEPKNCNFTFSFLEHYPQPKLNQEAQKILNFSSSLVMLFGSLKNWAPLNSATSSNHLKNNQRTPCKNFRFHSYWRVCIHQVWCFSIHRFVVKFFQDTSAIHDVVMQIGQEQVLRLLFLFALFLLILRCHGPLHHSAEIRRRVQGVSSGKVETHETGPWGPVHLEWAVHSRGFHTGCARVRHSACHLPQIRWGCHTRAAVEEGEYWRTVRFVIKVACVHAVWTGCKMLKGSHMCAGKMVPAKITQ